MNNDVILFNKIEKILSKSSLIKNEGIDDIRNWKMDFLVSIKENMINNQIVIDLNPKSGEGHDFKITIDLINETVEEVIIGEIELEEE